MFIFVLVLGGMMQQVLAQQTISNEDFEINLPGGWNYRCSDETGMMKHYFNKDSVSYTVNIYPISIYTYDAFKDYLPQGTKYVEAEDYQIISLEDGTEMEYLKVQGDGTNPKVSGNVYVAKRNDQTIIIQEVHRNDSLAIEDCLVEKFRWPAVSAVSFSERVDRFCNILNGALEKFASSEGICFRHSAEKKTFYIEQRLQNRQGEAKVLAKEKLEKKDENISEMFNLFPLFLEMGYNDYSFQLTRYLMNGKKESKVVYKPKDYKHLITRKNSMTSFTIRLVED